MQCCCYVHPSRPTWSLSSLPSAPSSCQSQPLAYLHTCHSHSPSKPGSRSGRQLRLQQVRDYYISVLMAPRLTLKDSCQLPSPHDART